MSKKIHDIWLTLKNLAIRQGKRLSLLQNERFTLIIGDEGVILVHVSNQQILARLFANSIESAEVEKFKALLAEHPHVPVYVLIDVMEQTYQAYNLPPVSSISINTLVGKRIERDFPGTAVLKGGYFIAREKTGRKDWLYLFASCPISEAIAGWLNTLYLQQNPLHSIHLLPLEMENVMNHPKIRAIHQATASANLPAANTSAHTNANAHTQEKAKAEPQLQEDRWDILFSHHKVSGFRQVAFKNLKMVLTRLIHSADDRFPDVTAGNVEQELQNSIEFLRRMASKEIKSFNIIIIVDQKIGAHIDPVRLAPHRIMLFSPFTFAKAIGLVHAATEKDKFAETAIAVALAATRRTSLPLHTQLSQMFRYLHWGVLSIKALTWITMPFVLLFLISDAWDIFSANKNLDELAVSQHQAQQEYDMLERKYNLRGKDVQQMQDMIALYRILTANQSSPFTTLENFSKVIQHDAMVKDFSWELLAPETLNDLRILGTGKEPAFKSQFNILFKNRGTGFEALFKNFENFIHRLENIFSAYTLQYSKPAQEITLGDVSDTTNITINISPKTEVATP